MRNFMAIEQKLEWKESFTLSQCLLLFPSFHHLAFLRIQGKHRATRKRSQSPKNRRFSKKEKIIEKGDKPGSGGILFLVYSNEEDLPHEIFCPILYLLISFHCVSKFQGAGITEQRQFISSCKNRERGYQ